MLLVGAGAVIAALAPQAGLISIDATARAFAVEHREPWLTSTLKILTWAGSVLVLAPVAAAVGLLLHHATHSWRPLLRIGASIVGAVVLSNLVKLAVARPRPDGALIQVSGYAFPSGHATAAAAGWLSMALAVTGLLARPAGRVAVVTIAVAITAVVGLSRVYLGVHELTDVISGWALGGLCVAVLHVRFRVSHTTSAAAPGRT